MNRVRLESNATGHLIYMFGNSLLREFVNDFLERADIQNP